MLMRQGNIDEAEKVVSDALVQTPDDPELHYASGVIAQERGDADGARAAFEKAIALKPDFFAALNGLGALQMDAGDHVGAAASFRAAIAQKPDFADAHFNLSLALRAAGDPETALQELEEANRLAPQDPVILVEMVHVYDGRKDTARADEAAKQAAQVGPQHAGAQFVYGQRLLAAGDAMGAVEHLQTASNLAPDDGEIRLELARAQIRAGMAKDAAAHLEKLATQFPQHGFVWSDWGAALAKQQQYDLALEKLDKAIELQPDLVSAKVRRVGVLADLGRCKEAKAAVKALSAAKAGKDALEPARAAAARCK